MAEVLETQQEQQVERAAIDAISRVMQRHFHGPILEDEAYPDLTPREREGIAREVLADLRAAGLELRAARPSGRGSA
jgi:cytosine/adenosine deaminase-related metal-dependent hydrolase